MANVQALRKESPEDRYQAVEDAYRSTNKKLGKEYFVVDCDRHIIEPPEAFTKYLDKEWEHMAPKPVTDNRGAPRLMIEGRVYQKMSGWGPGRTEGCGDQRPRGEGCLTSMRTSTASSTATSTWICRESTARSGFRRSASSRPTSRTGTSSTP